MKKSKSKGKSVSRWLCLRQVGTMKAFQRGLLNLILLGFGVQMVKAEEQEISVPQMIEKRSLCPILHASDG